MPQRVHPMLHPACAPAADAPGRRAPRTDAAQTPPLAFAWRVSRRAARALAPTVAERGADPELRLEFTPASAPGLARATLTLRDRGLDVLLRAADVELTVTDDAELRHADAPGWIRATWRPTPFPTHFPTPFLPPSSTPPTHLDARDALPGGELLYLRSPLLADLALPGGRYEPLPMPC